GAQARGHDEDDVDHRRVQQDDDEGSGLEGHQRTQQTSPRSSSSDFGVVTALTTRSVADAATNDQNAVQRNSCPVALSTAAVPTPASMPAPPPAVVARRVSMPNRSSAKSAPWKNDRKVWNASKTEPKRTFT